VNKPRVGPSRRALTGLSKKLVLTYDNSANTDGAGAQLQRIYGTYSIARLLGAAYLHSPLSSVSYQGLSALEENVADPHFHQEFNDLLEIKSDDLRTADFHSLRLPNISMEVLHELIATFDRRETGGRPIVARLATPYGIADTFADCYEVCKEVSPFASSARRGGALRVAIHVRRGELFVVDSDRMLPNAYYIDVAQQVAHVLGALHIEYELQLCTEAPTKALVVQPDHHGILHRIRTPVAISPDMYRLDEFDVLPNLVRFINGRAIDCLRTLATADVLVMSKSSFSYVGGILNRRGIVLYHPFWHRPPSSWMTVGPDGQFDHQTFAAAIKAL
jgi:hypothetical protein